MENFNDITQKHMAIVKTMGILDDEININQNDLKEISQDLGMTESEWNIVLREAEKRKVLAESHFKHKSYREAIKCADETLLLNPFIKGARGIKAKAYLLLFIHEEDQEYREMAEKQAKLTLAKESTDRKALEVLATLNSENRIDKSEGKGRVKNTQAILITTLGMIVMAITFYFMLFNNNPSTTNAREEKIENLEMDLQSAFEKQEAIISKVQGLLASDNEEDKKNKKVLKNIKSKLDTDLSIEEEYKLQSNLTQVLGEIIYGKSAVAESDLLNDLRIALEGAENRIKTKRKQYNKAVSDYKLDGGASDKYQKL